MFLHIGGDVVIALRDLVAIIDTTSMERGAGNLAFLKTAEEEGFFERVADGPTNSWVITTKKVYASPISSLTLKKRAGFLSDEGDESAGPG